MRNTFTIARGFKALLLAGGASTIVLAAPAFAQDSQGSASSSASTSKAADDTIVVTGSRIRTKDFESNTPTVTVDNKFLKESTTGAIEQQLNKLPQFVVSQSSTVKNNEGTLTNAGGDIQPNATNTPGAATVSLRGVGANRTLVLIDGRRGTPGNASGTVDISTIPSSALERVEIVSGGQSATYGADAVAGVTNFILRKNFQGLELDGTAGISQYGDGFEYTLSGIMGSDFADGRGNVSIAMSMNTRNGDYQKDRPWFRNLWANPNTTAGAGFFPSRPGITLSPALPANYNPGNPAAHVSPVIPGCEGLPQGCYLTGQFPGANPPVPNNTGAVYLNQDGSIFTTGYNGRGGSTALKPWPTFDSQEGTQFKTTSQGTLTSIDAFNELTVPTTRYNFLARGNYEINDWIGVFAQGMFSDSSTHTKQEPGPITSGWGIAVPWGNGTYTGNSATPSSVLANGSTNPAFQSMFPFLNCAGYSSGTGGCTNTEAFQQVVPQSIQSLLAARTNANAPIILAGLLPTLRETFSDVQTYNLIAGFEGYIPGTDWTWEAYVNHGKSRTLSRQTGTYSLDRTRDVFTSPNMGQNFKYTGNQDDPSNKGFGASTGTCTSGLNFFSGYAGMSEDCSEAIASDLNTRSEARQTIVETNFQGKLFNLPAGELRAAVGASYREEGYKFLNDGLATAGRSFLDQAIGIYPSANVDGYYDTKEFYGELLVPVLHNIPGIKQFNLELGGRVSDYSTSGTSYTFKILGDWEVTDWLRFRGGFNRAERAPNIAELQLSPQQAFRTDSVGDLCSTQIQNGSSANPTSNAGGAAGAADVEAVCQALIARDNGGIYVPVSDSRSYYSSDNASRQPTGGGFAFSYAVGNQYYRDNIDPNTPVLKPEKANTWTVGAVIQSPMSTGLLSRLQLSVDYWNITINDPIGLSTAGEQLQRCIDPTFNPAVSGASAGGIDSAQSVAAAQAAINNAACAAVYRNPTEGTTFGGGFNSAKVYSTYTNQGLVKLSGIDAQLNWSQDVGPGTLSLGFNGTYMFHFQVQNSDASPLTEYVGTEGTGLKGLNYGASYRWRLFGNMGYTWNGLNVNLQWQHTPATEDSGEAIFPTDNTGTKAYNLFNLSGSYQVTDNFSVRFGIDNLFNKAPDLNYCDEDLSNNAPGAVEGCSYSFFQDQEGRRFSLGANVKF